MANLMLKSVLLLSILSQAIACWRDRICIGIDINVNIGITRLDISIQFARNVISTVSGKESTAQFSVIPFSSNGATASSFSSNPADANAVLDSITSVGGTSNILAGINAAVSAFDADTDPDKTNLLIYVIGLGTGSNPALEARASELNARSEVSIIPVSIDDGGDDRGLLSLAKTPAVGLSTASSGDGNDFSKLVCREVGTKPNVFGDPHIRGFDGSRFDFHGEHNRRYKLYGRRGGDLVTSTISAVKADGKSARPLTYFREFGVRPAGTANTVRVSMMRCEVSRKWTIGAEVDGKAVEEHDSDDFKVERVSETKVKVMTRETDFNFQMIWPQNEHKAHLNFDLRMNRAPRVGDWFEGVLGMTVNSRIGHEKHQILNQSFDPVDRETALKKMFAVNELFPEWDTGRTIGGMKKMPKVRMTGSASE